MVSSSHNETNNCFLLVTDPNCFTNTKTKQIANLFVDFNSLSNDKSANTIILAEILQYHRPSRTPTAVPKHE